MFYGVHAMRCKNSEILPAPLVSQILLPLAALALVSCNSASGPVDAFDRLPPAVTSDFGQVEFASPPTSGSINTCIGPFVVQIQDGNRNALPNESQNNVQVALTESSGTGTFYSDANCTQPFTDPNGSGPSIPSGSTSATFYLEFSAPASNVTVKANAEADFSGNEIATTTINVN
jgi:hypothetical protein